MSTEQTSRPAPQSAWQKRSHEERVRMMLGWLVAFGAIAAVATVADFIAGVIMTAAVVKPY